MAKQITGLSLEQAQAWYQNKFSHPLLAIATNPFSRTLIAMRVNYVILARVCKNNQGEIIQSRAKSLPATIALYSEAQAAPLAIKEASP